MSVLPKGPPRAFHPPSREGHRRPYARCSVRIQRAFMRRNRRNPTVAAVIARYERRMRAEGGGGMTGYAPLGVEDARPE